MVFIPKQLQDLVLGIIVNLRNRVMHSAVRGLLCSLSIFPILTLRLSAQEAKFLPKSIHYECHHPVNPPLHFSHSILQKNKDWIIKLSWHIDLDFKASSFKLYRNGKLIETISAFQGPFRFLGPYHFKDKKRDIDALYRYDLVALNSYRHVTGVAKTKVCIAECAPQSQPSSK